MLKTYHRETPGRTGEWERLIPSLPKLQELPLFTCSGTNHSYYSCSLQLEAHCGVNRDLLGNYAFQRIIYFFLVLRTLAL